MANSGNMTGICLYALSPREEAVLKRVISFSSTQGRNYVLAEAQTADMLVVSDDTSVDPALMNPAGCLLVRIADAGATQDYDVLMQRPLLVTKVMRTLDQAKAMLSAAGSAVTKPSPQIAAVATEQPAEPAPKAPVSAPAPKPAMSLYAQILGGGAAKSAAVQSAESESTQEPESVIVNNTQLAAPPVEASSSVQSSSAAVTAQQEVAVAPVVTPAPTAAVGTTRESVPPSVDISGDGATNTTNTTALPQDAHHLALVVDDSAAIRKQLELELRAAGIAAEFAETGEEALEKVAAKRYDLIFLDIIMPGIDGYETCRQMRLRPGLKKTPVIMLSAKTSPLDEVQGVIAGASTYLTKPVKSDQLQQTLKRVSMWLDNFQVSA